MPTVITGIVVLAAQYAFTYVFPNPDLRSARIVWAPFAAYRNTSLHLIPKLALSLVFPIVVFMLYYRELKDRPEYQLSWILLLAGLFFAYGFAELGSRSSDMNFAWTGQIALFLLFVTSVWLVLPLIRQEWQQQKWNGRILAVSIAAMAHFLSGAFWFYNEWAAPGRNW